jgi:4'-phosphopantetheinyl transferase
MLGCDLELVEPRSDAFIADYFTAKEQALVAHAGADRFRLVALLWSAKESALKALRVGLRVDTRSVIVSPGNLQPAGESWHPLWVYQVGGETFHGWWQSSGSLLRTLVGDPQPDRPVVLRV